ncbi:prepilin-type N-terminal cleavage/methylation domain-containing protein [Myxococcota bacterium]|nr:prepilin-type N-terminal cleavage/methylation domain-containing protein [Myxococcota bacterium]
MRHPRRGFTLLEVVVALGVMAIIGLLSFQALSGSLRARDFMEEEEGFSRSAGTALDRLSRHLELAYLTTNTTAINSYRTVFIVKDGDERDELWLASLGHQRRFRDSREGDQAEVTFWTEVDPENDDAYVLMMRESQRIDEKPDEDGPVMPLAHGVQRFDLRLLDAKTGEWTEEWDSTGADQPNRLPRAVQIVLVLLAPDPDDPEALAPRTFVRTVPLAFSETLNRDAQAFAAQPAAE